jgi:hypothetical protein
VPSRPSDPFDAFTEATGLVFPNDLKTMLGDASVVSYGGLELGALPDVAVRSHPADLAAAHALADQLRSHLADSSGVDLAVQDVDGDLVIASSAAYASEIAADGALGSQGTAQLALGDVPGDVAVAGFVDLARIWPLAGGAVDGNVSHLRALGFWSARDGSATHTQVRLVVG